MGAGKSTAIEALGPIVDRTEDIDTWIERRVGMTVLDFFNAKKESGFREVEEEVVCELLADADGAAVALGGGSVLSERVRAALKNHIVVWLDIDKETAWERVQGSDRPLARERARFDELFEDRRPLYEELADAILPTGDPEMVVRAFAPIQALRKLPDETKLLWAASPSGEYPVFVGEELLDSDWWPLGGRRFCITDSDVGPLYGDRLEPLTARIHVEPGEQAKSMEEAERLLRELAATGMRRDDHLVALGGGVIGDLVGFCAHVYQRGVSVVHVPTTFVSQVDSAYGGKTGVDLPEGKNYVGAYELPAAVLADVTTLETLPPYEWKSGFVEALKTGLLAGGSLWEQVRSMDEPGSDAVRRLVFACARYKCGVVAGDERESGNRAVLNLGHTIGHAIETASAYGHHAHGEAVGLGLLAALRLSDAPDLRDEVASILTRHQLPVRFDSEALPIDAILEAMQRDKKRTADGIPFVLLAEPGKPSVGHYLDPDRVRVAVEELAE